MFGLDSDAHCDVGCGKPRTFLASCRYSSRESERLEFCGRWEGGNYGVLYDFVFLAAPEKMDRTEQDCKVAVKWKSKLNGTIFKLFRTIV